MSYQRHLEEFGNCTCKNRTGIEMMELEVEYKPGRYRFEKIPACENCFGLV